MATFEYSPSAGTWINEDTGLPDTNFGPDDDLVVDVPPLPGTTGYTVTFPGTAVNVHRITATAGGANLLLTGGTALTVSADISLSGNSTLTIDSSATDANPV